MPRLTDPPDEICRADQADWRSARQAGEQPPDLRDEIQGPASELRHGSSADDPLLDADPPEGEGSRAPGENVRPQAPVAPGTAQVTRDPSRSRAVEVEAAGGDPAALGYDRGALLPAEEARRDRQ